MPHDHSYARQRQSRIRNNHFQSPFINSPEDEREQQMLEYRRRQQQQGKIRPKRPSSPQASFADKLKRTYEWLATVFPDTFGHSSARRPLKLNILHDIKEFYKHNQKSQSPGLLLRAAMTRYLQWTEYLETLVEGAPRYDLHGNVCGYVTAEEAQRAQELIQSSITERLE